jgi:ribosomal protein S12 methylthiotransferase
MQKLVSSNNKVLFTSLGCARSLVDTEVMLGILLKAGMEVTDQVDQADFLVVNTCGFLASASKELSSMNFGKIHENLK